MSIGQIMGLVNLVAGIGIGYGAWQMYARNQEKLAQWSKKVGVVTGFKNRSVGESRSIDETGATMHPVIEYQTDSGSTITFESKLGSSSWKFGVGSEIEIIVNPHNPKEAEIKGVGAQDFGPIAMGAISGMMIFSAPVAFLFF